MDPEVYVARHNHMGLKLYGYRQIPDHITANDIGRFSSVLNIDRIELNSAPLMGDLFGGVAATERPSVRVTFDNQDLSWSHDIGNEVLLHQAMGLHLYYGGTNIFEFFRGEILRLQPTKRVCVVEFGEGGLLYQKINLPRADIYERPTNRADLLPVVYGDFLSATANSQEENSGGATPCICIDTANDVWMLSASRCDATPPEIYNSDKELQDPTTYTYFPDDDYGATGLRIAYIVLNNHFTGQLSARMRGTIDGGTGQLITSPVQAIAHFFTTYGTWTQSDFDIATFFPTQAALEARSYTIHWAFTEDRNAKEWLVELLRHYWVDHAITADSKLAFLFDFDPIPPERVWAVLDARQDLAGEDPEDSVVPDIDARNLCNAGILKYRRQWQSGDYAGEYKFENTISINLHGRHEPETPIELPGIRTDDHALNWVEQLARRTSFLPTSISFTVRGLRYPFLLPGSYLALSWRQAPAAQGFGWPTTAPRILKVRNLGMQLPNPYTGTPGEMTLECIDTGVNYRRTTYAVMIDNHLNLWFVYVNNAGTFTAEPGNPGMDSLTDELNPWRWLLRQAPNGLNYYIYPMTNEDGTGLRFDIDTVSPGGVGSSEPDIEFVNRRYEAYKIRVTDPPIPQIRTTRFS